MERLYLPRTLSHISYCGRSSSGSYKQVSWFLLHHGFLCALFDRCWILSKDLLPENHVSGELNAQRCCNGNVRKVIVRAFSPPPSLTPSSSSSPSLSPFPPLPLPISACSCIVKRHTRRIRGKESQNATTTGSSSIALHLTPHHQFRDNIHRRLRDNVHGRLPANSRSTWSLVRVHPSI